MARGLSRRDTVCGQNLPTLGTFMLSLCKRSYTWYFLGLSNRSCVALSLGHSIARTHDVPEHVRGRVQVPGKDQWAARWWTCEKFAHQLFSIKPCSLRV